MPDTITPAQVIEVLNNARVRFVLMGAHGLGGWMRKPRATQDVDVLVATRSAKKAVRELLTAFPHLEELDYPVVTRLQDRESKEVVIDVMKAHHELFREALKHTHTVTSGKQTYRIPSLEMALALKFASMLSMTWSNPKKYQDAHDFMAMILANSDIDQEKLTAFGEFVYPGGGKVLVEKVGQVRRGEKFQLEEVIGSP
jgi:hypothetical protein